MTSDHIRYIKVIYKYNKSNISESQIFKVKSSKLTEFSRLENKIFRFKIFKMQFKFLQVSFHSFFKNTPTFGQFVIKTQFSTHIVFTKNEIKVILN